MRGLLNPWSVMGAGLLSTQGQLNPANATFGAGLSKGIGGLLDLESFNLRKSQVDQNAMLQQAKLDLLKSKQGQEEAQRAQQQQAVQGLLSSIPDPAQRAQLANLFQVDPGAAVGLLTAKPDKVDKWSEPYLDTSTGKPILVQRNEDTGALKSIGAGGVTVNNNTVAKPPPGFNWGEGGSVVPIPGGPQDPDRVSPAEARKSREEQAAQSQAKGNLSRLINDYTSLGEGASGLSPTDRAKVGQARRNLAVAIARARDPGGRLTDADVELAMEDVPDPFGPIDSYTFKGAMENLEKLLVGDAPKVVITYPPPPAGFIEDK